MPFILYGEITINKPPAFQFYPKDFVSDLNVASMTMEERGQYITLLCHCWIEDGIPIGSPLVKQWLKKDSTINGCFYRKNGKIRHKRLDEEREKQIKWAEKSSKGGKKTQEKRWEGVKKESRGDRLKRAKQKGTHTEKDWQMMIKICGNKCVKCGISESKLYGEKLCKDHVIPICLNGSDAIENIQPICRNCNTAKTNEQIDYRPNGWKQLLTNNEPKSNSSSSSSSSSSSIIEEKSLILKGGNNDTEKFKNKIITIQKAWNSFAAKEGFTEALKINESRKNKLRLRIKEELFDINKILIAAKKQPFLMGENDRDWAITFDFIIANDSNFIKILELYYLRKEKKSWAERFERKEREGKK